MLRIASEHIARVPLIPVNSTIASLVLCKPVASTSGAHFIFKMTASTFYQTGGLFLKWRESNGPKKDVTNLPLFQRRAVKPGKKWCTVCPLHYPLASCPNHSLPGMLTQEGRLNPSLSFLNCRDKMWDDNRGKVGGLTLLLLSPHLLGFSYSMT